LRSIQPAIQRLHCRTVIYTVIAADFIDLRRCDRHAPRQATLFRRKGIVSLGIPGPNRASLPRGDRIKIAIQASSRTFATAAQDRPAVHRIMPMGRDGMRNPPVSVSEICGKAGKLLISLSPHRQRLRQRGPLAA